MRTQLIGGTVARGVGAAAVALLAALGLVAPAQAAVNDTTLVSRASGPTGAPADDRSDHASLSADGRLAVFVSQADNLSADDNNSVANVFVRDLQAGTTTLVSRADGPAGAGADADSTDPSISADGRYVAFASTATNLSNADLDTCDGLYYMPGPCPDVFVRDLITGSTTLVSRTDGAAGGAATGASFVPTIFPDGGRVIFTSVAANLSTQDTDACTAASETGPFPAPCVNVFVRDVRAGTTRYLAPGRHHVQVEGCRSAVSGDGRVVAVETDESLDPADVGSDDLYVIDLQTGAKQWVRASGGTGAALCASLSADGRAVAFVGSSSLVDGGVCCTIWDEVYVKNLTSGVLTVVSQAPDGFNKYSSNPSISGDGRLVAFYTQKSISTTGPGVYVRDLQTGSATFVSRASGADGAPAIGYLPSMSLDGRIVAFSTDADTISPADNDLYRNVFVRELGAPAPPPPACTSATATSDADSWIAQNTPTATNGASTSLAVRSKPSANQRALVHFALPAVPAGCTVTGAVLRLNAASATNRRTLQAAALAAPWAEGTVTWSNQPSTTGTAATSASGTGWRQWTVTAQVQAMYAGANHGFLIRDASEGAGTAAQSFGSREGGAGTAPQLVVTFGVR
jgi:Tol biopolymer transport system component